MAEKIDQYYLIKQEMLTEAMQKTLEAKELLESGKVQKVQDAVDAVNISRSAFYKYKDAIFPFHTVIKEQVITLSIQLADQAGALSALLSELARVNTNVLTINQSIPLGGRANVTLTIDTSLLKGEISDFVKTLEGMETVESVEIVGSGWL
ncbi:ACT domain-containing protein [Aliibacillus thermotolerans]|uniref:UPF0735 ACT domain-containing protein ACFPTR_13325 n=1 Tax=Aliibacillus thermotolerans TaxID=1834418 RepID=A0ABW0UBY4_9BACI|nr:ACT domain-containing protein [Aliibacillus thermotolerans]MDA3130834.1 ACT domain-containing protein [Aliibacillus thermotolerans]